MKLIYKIQEGNQVLVRRVLITGYKHTRRRVIQRQVKVQAGQPLREGDVVESQQKLYNLGVFNRVTIDAQNANGTDPEKDVVVLVEEAKRYTIAYGGGFEVQRLASTTDPTGGEIEASPRGIFEISKQDLTGRADTLSLKLRGSLIQGRALLAYSSPETFNSDKLSLQATAYVEKSQDINTFTQTRYEGNLQITDRLTSRSSLLLRYAFRKVNLSNLNVPQEEVPLFYQPTLVSEFSATWFRDTRDNPADASKGSFNTADLSVAGTAIGSSASFFRLFMQNSTYHTLSRNWSFARSIRSWNSGALCFDRVLELSRTNRNAFAPAHSASRAPVCWWWNLTARLRSESGRTARRTHRISSRWPGHAHPEPGIALSFEAPDHRNQSGWRFVLRRRERL